MNASHFVFRRPTRARFLQPTIIRARMKSSRICRCSYTRLRGGDAGKNRMPYSNREYLHAALAISHYLPFHLSRFPWFMFILVACNLHFFCFSGSALCLSTNFLFVWNLNDAHRTLAQAKYSYPEYLSLSHA